MKKNRAWTQRCCNFWSLRYRCSAVQIELSSWPFSKKSLVASLLSNQRRVSQKHWVRIPFKSECARSIAGRTMLSYSLHFILSNVFFVFKPKRAVFNLVKIDNSEFAVVFVRLPKLCMRLVKTNLAQSSVANQSTYYVSTNQQQRLWEAYSFSRAGRRLYAFASNSDWLATYFPLLWLARLALLSFQRLTQVLCH